MTMLSKVGFEDRTKEYSSNYLMSWVGYILLARTLVPPELQYILRQCWALFMRPFTSLFCVFHIYKKHKGTGKKNHLYALVEMYLNEAGLSKAADEVVLATKSEKEKHILYKLTGRESIEDKFKGVTVWWSVTGTDDKKTGRRPLGSPKDEGDYPRSVSGKTRKEFVLKMHKKDKEFVMREYLDHVVEKAGEFKREQKELTLFSNGNSNWKRGVSFKHPSTFDTLAMDPALKRAVKADLDKFRQSEAYFRRVGRAWKRGYLLYGPPGTGKSSMIAAIANYLKYDVYDLELTEVRSNDSLKKLFRYATTKSIIVIEDIDCSLNLSGTRSSNATSSPPHEEKRKRGHSSPREEDVTLSALLNSTDGLWSCGTDENIIIFTTNHVEKLDPALIRAGRMDMHIHMSYCSFESFKELARSYLFMDSHPAFETIRFLMEEEGVLITPAEVTEHMFGKQDDPDDSMCSLIAQLRKLQNPNLGEPRYSVASKEIKATGGDNSQIPGPEVAGERQENTEWNTAGARQESRGWGGRGRRGGGRRGRRR